MQYIPKVFHQIWINKENPELPEKYTKYRDSWLALHPDWSYQLWNLDNLPFKTRFSQQLAQCTNYAQMADILRYEILYELGGVYIDTDFECKKSIEPLLKDVRNFSCSEDGRTISIGLVGAEKKSKILEQCIINMPKVIGLTVPTKETGPAFFTYAILNHGFNGDLTLFPREYFYPYNWNETHRENEEFPNAYGVHRWASSWKSETNTLRSRLWFRFNHIKNKIFNEK